jgi:hypothetical protein
LVRLKRVGGEGNAEAVTTRQAWRTLRLHGADNQHNRKRILLVLLRQRCPSVANSVKPFIGREQLDEYKTLQRFRIGSQLRDLPMDVSSCHCHIYLSLLGVHLQPTSERGIRMRMLFVILTGIILLFTITMGWYISQTLVTSIATAFAAQITGTSEGSSLLSLLEFCNIVWGPVFDFLVVLWMVASAQARDVESEIYR